MKLFVAVFLLLLLSACDKRPDPPAPEPPSDDQFADLRDCDELDRMVEQLESLSLRYTEKHPQIVALQESIRTYKIKCQIAMNNLGLQYGDDWIKKEYDGLTYYVVPLQVRSRQEEFEGVGE